MLAYLTAENDYFGHWAGQHDALLDKLFEEMKGRIKEDESSVPIRDGDWLYWWAFKPGAQYRTWYRRKFAGGDDQIIYRRAGRGRGQGIFPPGRARGQSRRKARRHPCRRQRVRAVHPAHPRSRDRRGHRDRHRTSAIGHPVWTSDCGRDRLQRGQRPVAQLSRALPPARHADRPGRHALRGDRGARLLGRRRQVAGQEPDRHRHRRQCDQRGPLRFRRRSDPAADARLPAQGEAAVRVDAAHGKLWILTNDDHVNFRLAEADPASPGEWRTVIPGSDRVYLRARHVLPRPSRDPAAGRRPRPADPAHLRRRGASHSRSRKQATAPGFLGNPEFAPDAYRLAYSSMVTPATIYDYHPRRRPRSKCCKVQEIPSGYDASKYETERLMVTARDGAKVPVSVVYPEGLREGRQRQAVPLRLWRLRPSPSRRRSTPTGSACSTAAGPAPSPTSAAATTSATNGSSTASSRSAPTRSTTSSTSRRG